VTGVSGDICPDHFLVSNLSDIQNWAGVKESDCLFIETAGLCNRCSPATEKTIAISTADATCHINLKSPQNRLADIIVVTKTDLVSQAEREIIQAEIRESDIKAAIFFFNGKDGCGAEEITAHILSLPGFESYENDLLRHTMPSGVCSYCVGECRVGSAYQAGVVGKMNFEEGK
jgi:Ni2+-binding GTPase involved in regulation of expression and maturation of urease and hydrogenase